MAQQKFIITGLDTENPPIGFGITIDTDNDTAIITDYESMAQQDNNSFLSCMLNGFKPGEARSYADNNGAGFGHAILQYIINTHTTDSLWFNYVSIARVL